MLFNFMDNYYLFFLNLSFILPKKPFLDVFASRLLLKPLTSVIYIPLITALTSFFTGMMSNTLASHISDIIFGPILAFTIGTLERRRYFGVCSRTTLGRLAADSFIFFLSMTRIENV